MMQLEFDQAEKRVVCGIPVLLAASVTARRSSARSDKGSQKGNGDYIRVILLHQGAEQSQEQATLRSYCSVPFF